MNFLYFFPTEKVTEHRSDNVPHEALRIASILGCDEQLISLAQENINH